MIKRIYILCFIFFVNNLYAFNFLPTNLLGETVHQKYYSISYSENHEQAEWAAHILTRESANGRTSRTEDFRSDPSIISGSADLTDYRGSGYDRGHLVPAADMRLNKQSMSETFLLSNISPQVSAMNRGVWAKIESKVRTFVQTEEKVYVITGPVFDPTNTSIGENQVTVPSAYFKIVLDYNGSQSKMTAFLVPNANTNAPLESYLVSVDYIEGITGLDFFPELEDELEDKLEFAATAWPTHYLN